MLNIKTQGEYNKIVEDLQNIVEFYEHLESRDNQYKLFLANGESINYRIHENNIPHLLGIKPENLMSLGLVRKDTHFNVLKEFFYQSYSIYTKIQEGRLKYTDIFSPYIDEKIKAFKSQMMVPYPNNIYFVCEYDRERVYGTKEIDGLNADYYIARKFSAGGGTILLGLVEYKPYHYAVQTSRIIKKDEDLKELLNNQVITYVTTLRILNFQTDFNREIYLGIEEKKEAIKNLNDLSKKTNSIPNTISSNLFDLNGVSIKSVEIKDKKEILSMLTCAMTKNEIFEMNDIPLEIRESLDDEIKNIISNYNDYICSSTLLNSGAKTKYSDLEKENERLLDEKNNLETKVLSLEDQVRDLKAQKEELESYKQKYIDFTEKVYALVDDEKQKSKK